MTNRQRQDAALNSLRMIPTKWAIAILAIVIGYVLLQPRLNNWFGWNLPSVAAMLGDEKPKATTSKSKKETVGKASSKEANEDDGSEKSSKSSKKSSTSKDDKQSNKSGDIESLDDERDGKSLDTTLADKKPSDQKPPVDKTTKEKSTDQNLFDFLKTASGRNRYKSPAGLIYGPGSEEGHRLKHIERHLSDQPDRPGSHGVFDGDMHDFLVAIDDAYTRAKRGDKGTKEKKEDAEGDESIVYEASFPKAIGYLGGRDGERKKHPKLTHMRIVVRGENLITAFPF